MIYEINHYMNCGNEIKWRNNCCSECNLCNCVKKEAWKKFRNPQLTCSQCLWLHSSVGRASHRYREVTGSNPVEVLNFFSGFFTQLHKLCSLWRSFLHFIIRVLYLVEYVHKMQTLCFLVYYLFDKRCLRYFCAFKGSLRILFKDRRDP